MEPRPGLPAFWITHLSKALVGEQPCLLSPWLAGRFVLPRRGDPAALANWKADHTALLQATVARYKADGWKCDVERFFRVPGQHAVVSGKSDLIVQKADQRPRIIDAKSGVGKDSDVAQVLLEMILIPMAWKKSITFEGEVLYASGNSIVLNPSEAETMKPKLFGLIRQLATMPKPTPSPSRDACRFCDVPDAECGVRWKETEETVALTTEF